jgi:hypothetical protein
LLQPFNNGQALAEVVQLLVAGRLRVRDILSIRVVYFRNRWMTLDNRRLRVFKDALLKEVTVVMCDHADKKLDKNSN